MSDSYVRISDGYGRTEKLWRHDTKTTLASATNRRLKLHKTAIQTT
jgi:hypothetical protein